jgi:hypothetical protein
VHGIANRLNLWDQRTHPWIPFSKFLIDSPDGELNLEARVVGPDAPQILDRLASQPTTWDGCIAVTGRLMGVDLPMMKTCRRALVLIVSDPETLDLDSGHARSRPAR